MLKQYIHNRMERTTAVRTQTDATDCKLWYKTLPSLPPNQALHSLTHWLGGLQMQGQTSTLSSVHRPLLILLSSAERSVSRHVSTFSTCGWCSSLCANCRFVILLFLAALFSPEIQRLENHDGVWKKGRSIFFSFYNYNIYMQDVYIRTHTRCTMPIIQ